MKILVIGHIPIEFGGNFTTGVGNVVYNLNFELCKKDLVYLLATNVKPWHLMKERIINANYTICSILNKYTLQACFRPLTLLREIKSYRKKFGSRTLKSILYRLAIEAVCKKYEPDIIHFHGVHTLPSFFFTGCKIPYVVTYHGVFYKTEYSFSDQSGLNTSNLYLETSKRISASTFLNEEMQSYAIANLEYPELESTVIGNGVNIERFFFSQDERDELRKRLAIRQEEKLLITVGTIQKRKGQRKFIENNFCFFKESRLKYLVIGKGPDYQDLHEYIKSEGLLDSIIMLDYIAGNELYKYYSAADYYILPSTSEGLPLVTLEALACGLPVIFREDLGKIFPFSTLDFCINSFSINNPIINYLNEYSRLDISNIARNELSWKRISTEYSTFFLKLLRTKKSD